MSVELCAGSRKSEEFDNSASDNADRIGGKAKRIEIGYYRTPIRNNAITEARRR